MNSKNKIYLYPLLLMGVLFMFLTNPAGHCYGQTSQEYFKKGMAKKDRKNYKGAMADFNKAIELNPQFAEALLGRAIVKAHWDNYQGAIADCSKAIEIDSLSADAYYIRGFTKLRMKLFDSGCSDLSKAEKLGNAEASEVIKKHCK